MQHIRVTQLEHPPAVRQGDEPVHCASTRGENMPSPGVS
jgi:hypothetical protein